MFKRLVLPFLIAICLISNLSADDSIDLISACYNGDLNKAKSLIEKGVSVESKTFDGYNALFVAALKGRYSLVKYLIEKGADVNARTLMGGTPLTVSIYFDESSIARLLVENGADIHMKSRYEYGELPLNMALIKCNYELVEYLLKKNVDVTKKGRFGNTALHVSSGSAKLSVTKKMISKGVSVNVRNDNGTEPIHFAAKSGKLELVKYLLQEGADPWCRNKYGYTPFHWAGKNSDVVRELLMRRKEISVINAKTNNSITPLMLYAREGSAKSVALILDNGADVNIRSELNSTALHEACLRGSLDVVKMIVTRGVNINAIDNEGETPVSCALSNAIYQEIRKESVSLFHEDKNDSDGFDIIKFLIKKGVKLHLNEKRGYSLLGKARNRYYSFFVLRDVADNPPSFSKLKVVKYIKRVLY